MFFKYLCFFPSKNSKSIYTFESTSLQLMHNNRVVYLTVLTPMNKVGILVYYLDIHAKLGNLGVVISVGSMFI